MTYLFKKIMAYKRFKPKIVPKNCPFCKEKSEPNFKDVEVLRKYISERGKILSHLRTGVCNKHQKHIAHEIKHARFLALVPFISRV